MNPITSADFRSRNEILFQSKILAHTGWNFTANCGATHYRVGDFDVIDLNKNGKADTEYQKTGWTTYRQKFTEPSLVHGFDKIKEYAQRNQAEVVTQDDIRDPLIETGGMSGGTTVFTKDELIHENQRGLGTLVDQLEPFEKNAKWAIDVTTQEFVLYKPR